MSGDCMEGGKMSGDCMEGVEDVWRLYRWSLRCLETV